MGRTRCLNSVTIVKRNWSVFWTDSSKTLVSCPLFLCTWRVKLIFSESRAYRSRKTWVENSGLPSKFHSFLFSMRKTKHKKTYTKASAILWPHMQLQVCGEEFDHMCTEIAVQLKSAHTWVSDVAGCAAPPMRLLALFLSDCCSVLHRPPSSTTIKCHTSNLLSF